DHGLAGISGLVDAVDQLALVVGLQEVDTDTEPGGVLGQTSLDVGRGGGAVDLGLALSESVEVRTVEDQDAGHWCGSGVCGVCGAMSAAWSAAASGSTRRCGLYPPVAVESVPASVTTTMRSAPSLFFLSRPMTSRSISSGAPS